MEPVSAPAFPLEMHPPAAGLRVLVALLCTLLVGWHEKDLPAAALGVLLVYDAWSICLAWLAVKRPGFSHSLALYWIDVCWSVAMISLTSAADLLLVVTLIQPLVLTGIGFGLLHTGVLACAAAVALLLDGVREHFGSTRPFDSGQLLMALVVLALAVLWAHVARLIVLRRKRLEQVDAIANDMDPRRGLHSTVATFVQALRRSMGADVVALEFRGKEALSTVLCASDEEAFQVSPETQRRIEHLLDALPPSPCTHVLSRRWNPDRGDRLHEPGVSRTQVLMQQFDDLALLLGVRALVIVPLSLSGLHQGHLIAGIHDAGKHLPDVDALTRAARSLNRLIEQSELVDHLQDETALHERARIGRDLHDSAIQPYLGLKYAIESLALRTAPDNPVHGDVLELMQVVNAEVDALRELISNLRTAQPGVDDALLTALRRQAGRFSRLFGIQTELHGPDGLTTSRAVAGELFHMVNEALNNVRKHTRARHVRIDLEPVGDTILLRVRDDAGSITGQRQSDFWPRSLDERVSAMNGSLEIRCSDGLNTEIVMAIPRRAQR